MCGTDVTIAANLRSVTCAHAGITSTRSYDRIATARSDDMVAQGHRSFAAAARYGIGVRG
jgi:hypothetical protein